MIEFKGAVIFLKYKAVVFDLDGTLANSLEDLKNAVNYGIKKLGFYEPTVEEYRLFVGNGTEKMIERALKENATKENIEKVKQDYLEYYGKHFADYTKAYEGMPELIQKLHKNGVKIAVVTNKVNSMASTVVTKLYGNYFDIIEGQRDGIPAKPDPTLTLMVMEKLGVKPNECAFVGDSGVDIKTGKNSGAAPIGVLWGFREKEELILNGAKYIAKTAKELEELLLD